MARDHWGRQTRCPQEAVSERKYGRATQDRLKIFGAMLTQIYEITSAEEAAALSRIGIDHIGVLVGDGSFPREQSVASAMQIAAAIRPPSKLSALFLSSDMALVICAARKLEAAVVHLGAAPDLVTREQVLKLRQALPGVLVMRSVPVTGPESMALATLYDGIADYILLDSYRASDKQIGALGITHDWSISRQSAERLATPVILAGGLGPDNVADAIRAVRPAGVELEDQNGPGRDAHQGPGEGPAVPCGGAGRKTVTAGMPAAVMIGYQQLHVPDKVDRWRVPTRVAPKVPSLPERPLSGLPGHSGGHSKDRSSARQRHEPPLHSPPGRPPPNPASFVQGACATPSKLHRQRRGWPGGGPGSPFAAGGLRSSCW